MLCSEIRGDRGDISKSMHGVWFCVLSFFREYDVELCSGDFVS